jgi:hypothetical protein
LFFADENPPAFMRFVLLRQVAGSPVKCRFFHSPFPAMTTATQIPADPLADLANADTQRLAARMAPDVGVLGEVAAQCANWCRAGGSDEARALRLALLISGLDQWGLAYTQAFGLTAIHPLTALIGGLRTRLDAREESRFQQYFEQLDAVELDAIDFKVDLRRGIHLALWHAMAASESAEQVEAIVHTLGSLMIALDQKMPELGWRLVADALAHIQIGLLSGQAPNPEPVVMNTCYSFVDGKNAIHVASVHQYDAATKTVQPVKGAGGVSVARNELEGKAALGWAKNIWADMLT